MGRGDFAVAGQLGEPSHNWQFLWWCCWHSFLFFTRGFKDGDTVAPSDANGAGIVGEINIQNQLQC